MLDILPLRPPRPLLFGIAFGAIAALMLSSVIYHQNLLKQQQGQTEAYGQITAKMLAQQAIDATFNRDLVSLQVIASHSSSDERIRAVTIHDVENRLLVQSGNLSEAGPQSHNFSAPITVQDNIAGHLTVTLDSEVFQPQADYRWLLGGLLGLILLAFYAWQRPDEQALSIQARHAHQAQPGAEGDDHDQQVISTVPTTETHNVQFHVYAVVCCSNLNRLHQQLNAEALTRVLNHFEQQVNQVTALYGGYLCHTDKQEFTLKFSSVESVDQSALQAICAAELLLSLGRTNNHAVSLQYSVVVNLPAQDGTLQQRIQYQHQRQALLDTARATPWRMMLTPNIPAQCNLQSWLSTDADEIDNFSTVSQFTPPYRALLDKQLQRLRAHS